MSENPFDFLLDNYREQVDEADKAGNADIFKECTELFFDAINNDELPGNRHFTYNIEDVQYLDGYYIFGFGTNSVVHFRVKECPGWLFGIWWYKPDETGAVRGDLFAQYEETIDKFKPSRSSICKGLYASKTGGKYEIWDAGSMRYIFDFIKNEPHLAFCRDYFNWDYNREYHTREEAEKEFNEYCEHRDREKKLTDVLNKRVFDFVTERVLHYFNNAKIEDLGDCITPRYEVRAPFKDNKDLVDKPGSYSWFADDDEVGAEITAEYNNLIDRCDKVARENGVYWFRPLHDSIHFYGGAPMKGEKDDN